MKNNQLISALLIFTLVLSMAVFVSADNPASLRLGDTTGDGSINAGDALEVLQYSVGNRDKFTAEGGTLNGTGNGTPPPPPHFETVEELDSYLSSLTLPPEGFDLTQGYYDYLRPGLQDMLIKDRYYLVPDVGLEYTVVDIGVYPQAIGFLFKNEQEEQIAVSCYTKPTGVDYFLSNFKKATMKRHNGVDYCFYFYRSSGGKEQVDYMVACSYGDYLVSINTYAHESQYITDEELIKLMESVVFTKVTLPPLK